MASDHRWVIKHAGVRRAGRPLARYPAGAFPAAPGPYRT
jgi:hypothetical protein